MAAPAADADVLVLGTAHVLDLAGPIRATLADRPLDAIAIELDDERAPYVLAPTPPSGGRARVPLFVRLWSVLQRRLGADLGAGAPGAEMRVAAAIAHERRLPLFLVDDPIRAMMARLVASMPLRERVTLLVGAVVGLFLPSRLVRAQVETYAERPGDVLDDLRAASPTIARVLLDERNEHMAERIAEIRRRGFRRIAVVVGDAHVAGLAAGLARREVPHATLGFGALRRLTAPSSSSS